jgi:hypothetical protein
MLRRVIWWKFTNILEVLPASIIRVLMEAASTSETSVSFYQTTRGNIQEDYLHTRCRENLKSNLYKPVIVS